MRRWKRALELLCQTRKRALATAGVVRDSTLNQVCAAKPLPWKTIAQKLREVLS
jgi:hypothetical protein